MNIFQAIAKSEIIDEVLIIKDCIIDSYTDSMETIVNTAGLIKLKTYDKVKFENVTFAKSVENELEELQYDFGAYGRVTFENCSFRLNSRIFALYINMTNCEFGGKIIQIEGNILLDNCHTVMDRHAPTIHVMHGRTMGGLTINKSTLYSLCISNYTSNIKMEDSEVKNLTITECQLGSIIETNTKHDKIHIRNTMIGMFLAKDAKVINTMTLEYVSTTSTFQSDNKIKEFNAQWTVFRYTPDIKDYDQTARKFYYTRFLQEHT